jgi:hypothetical protein
MLGAGGLIVLGLGIWLRRMQARFVAGLRADGDPLAAHPGSKAFRQRFTAWLFGLGGVQGPAPGRSLLTLLMVIVILAAAAWSLLPWVFG